MSGPWTVYLCLYLALEMGCVGYHDLIPCRPKNPCNVGMPTGEKSRVLPDYAQVAPRLQKPVNLLMPRVLNYWIVDAFTSAAFKGNSAAVVLLDQSFTLPDPILQSVAAEFNLAETAFVTPIEASCGLFNLRWFTPTIEFPLCGHATLATASVLFGPASASSSLPETVKKEITFRTMSGDLKARALPDGRIELELPAGGVTPVEVKEKVERAVRRAFDGRSNVDVVFVGRGEGLPYEIYLLVEIDGIDLRTAFVDPKPLRDLCPQYEVIVLTQCGRTEGSTFTSRVFCPQEVVPEDPVTGSAHCMLGPYWAARLQIDGLYDMLGKQVSMRSGEVGVVWDRGRRICRLKGNTKLMAKGELYLRL